MGGSLRFTKTKALVSASLSVGAVVTGIALTSGTPAHSASVPAPPSNQFCRQSWNVAAQEWNPEQVLPGATPAEARMCAQMDQTKPHPMWDPAAKSLAKNPDGSLKLYWENLNVGPPLAATGPDARPRPHILPPPKIVTEPGIDPNGFSCLKSDQSGLTAQELAICRQQGF